MPPDRRTAQPPTLLHQRWLDLLFLHFPLDPAELPLPEGLTPETFEGRAWVGLVPFRMAAVRPRGLPPVPGLSWFPETNVRTYVHGPDGRTAVWFSSLDAANALVCRIARATFGLPYFPARMSATRDGDRVRYVSTRPDGGCEIEAVIGAPIPTDDFARFLTDRWEFLSLRRGRWVRGRVDHAPYALRAARVERLEQTLIPFPVGPLAHACFCDGVAVRASAPRVVS